MKNTKHLLSKQTLTTGGEENERVHKGPTVQTTLKTHDKTHIVMLITSSGSWQGTCDTNN